MASGLSRRYRYGASFTDEASGVRFEGHHPLERPDLWRRYLDDAEGKYRSYGFEGTLRRRELDEGIGIPLFLIGFGADGEPVVGVRFHGPVENRWGTALMEEMAELPEIDDIGDLIDREARFGIIEAKGAWARGEAVVGVRLVTALSRAMVHAANWLGAERTIACVSDALVPLGKLAGGEVLSENWVPFPDARYRTVAVTWQRSRASELADPDNQRALRREAEQLLRGPDSHAVTPNGGEPVSLYSRHPVVLDVTRRSDREVMRVLREDPALEVVDRFEDQRSQLTAVRPVAEEAARRDVQRWVYYPWRRAVVRVLGPRAFDRVRLDRNRHKITADEQARLRGLRVGVVGASAGHAIAYTLALEGIVGELRIADFDTLELSNLNRVPASVLDIGVNKAVVAARRIAEIDPYLKVSAVTSGVTEENLDAFLEDLDLVVEECDSLDMKVRVREAARSRRIPVIMETSDRGVLDVERFDLDPTRPIFHGLLGDLDSSRLSELTPAELAGHMIKVVGPSQVSARMAASFFEFGTTITGWPQLGSEVSLGGVTVAAAVRRLGLGRELPSGQVRLDVDEILGEIEEVDPSRGEYLDLASAPPTEPPLDDTDDDVTYVVDAARRAPSGGNVQPWRFEADADEVRFFMLPERTSAMDVAHRGTFVALGAALMNARVAAAARRRLGMVQLFPHGPASHHVATMGLGDQTDPALAGLIGHVATRTSNRQAGQPGAIPTPHVEHLTHAVTREGATLRFVSDRTTMDGIGDVLGRSDRLRFILPHVREQMLGELRFPGRDRLEDGLDVRSLEMDPATIAVSDVLRRPDVMDLLAEWRAGQSLGLRTQLLIGTSSALAAITVPRDEPAWYVRGGQALERFWLTAETIGLAVQPVAPLFLYATGSNDLLTLGGERYVDELARLSDDLKERFEIGLGEALVMVVRISYAPAASVHSIRHPLGEVLTRSDMARLSEGTF